MSLCILVLIQQTAVANVLAPATQAFADTLSQTQLAQTKSMHLGQWRNHISEKINPSYFRQLTEIKATDHNKRKLFNYSVEVSSYEAPVFLNSDFSYGLNSALNDSSLYFSFSTTSLSITPFALNQFFASLNPQNQLGKSKTNIQVVKQDLYAPSYTFSHGNSALGLGFILIQQRFLDDSFGAVFYADSSSSLIANNQSLLNSNRGIGYNLNFAQNLPTQIELQLNYQTKIKMNEFDLFGQSYSDPGDFDIPSHYSASVSVPFLRSNTIHIKAENIQYSGVNTPVHSGYSDAFLAAFNSPISPIFKLDDLTVYSLNYEKHLNDDSAINFGVLSRQQAPALARIYNRILKNDTASVSYQLGFLHKLSLGEINFVASFANKPILIGSTDFGRFSDSTLGQHLEGVISWNLSF